MGLLAVFSTIVAFVSLVLARYLSAPHWVYALFGIGLGLGGVAVALVGLVCRRFLRPDERAVDRVVVVAIACALPALLLRHALLEQAIRLAAGPVLIDFGQILAAMLSLVLGAAALVHGARGLGRLAAGQARRPSFWSKGLRFAGATFGVTVGLYCLAPLLRVFGFGVNHWTFLGLLALAGAAYGVQWLAARITTLRRRKAQGRMSSAWPHGRCLVLWTGSTVTHSPQRSRRTQRDGSQ